LRRGVLGLDPPAGVGRNEAGAGAALGERGAGKSDVQENPTPDKAGQETKSRAAGEVEVAACRAGAFLGRLSVSWNR